MLIKYRFVFFFVSCFFYNFRWSWRLSQWNRPDKMGKWRKLWVVASWACKCNRSSHFIIIVVVANSNQMKDFIENGCISFLLSCFLYKTDSMKCVFQIENCNISSVCCSPNLAENGTLLCCAVRNGPNLHRIPPFSYDPDIVENFHDKSFDAFDSTHRESAISRFF